MINAMMAGMGDCTANLTSGLIGRKFGVLYSYRFVSILGLLITTALWFLQIKDWRSYPLVWLNIFCIGCILNFASATVFEKTDPTKLKWTLTIAVTIGSTSCTLIPITLLTKKQPVALYGLLCFLTATTILTTLLICLKDPRAKPKPKVEIALQNSAKK